MDNTNYIKKFRQEKKLSQRELAKLAGTSQQQIQRLEVGIAPIRLDLASRISDALGQPMGKVFPALSPVLKKFTGRKLQSDKAQEELEKAGVEIDEVIWTVELGLRNGASVQYMMPSARKRDLEEFLANYGYHSGRQPGIPFFWFDSNLDSVSVNLGQIVYSRFMYDSPRDPSINLQSNEKSEEDPGTVRVWLNNRREPLKFIAALDEVPEQQDEEEVESGRLQQLLIELDGNLSDDDFVSFMDEDGEEVYLRVADISLIAVPQCLLEPDLHDDNEEDNELELEDEANQKPDGPSLLQ
jgi:transcriptional regulator with XRE-family HTH domain